MPPPLACADPPADVVVSGANRRLIARWAVYVVLRGEYAYVSGVGWHRWTPKGWRASNGDAVRSRVRVGLEDAYQRAGAGPLDYNLVAGLDRPLRTEATVEPSRVGVGR